MESVRGNLISTTELSRRLRVTVSVSLMKRLGFAPKENHGRAKYWDLDEFPQIRKALIDYISTEE